MNDPERKAIYCYQDKKLSDSDEYRYVAIDDCGHDLCEIFALDDNTAKMLLREQLSEIGKTSTTCRVVWVDDPASTQEVLDAWSRSDRIREADQDPSSPRQLRAVQGAQHLCHSCGHATTCVLAVTIRGPFGALNPTVTACGGYEPPLPGELRDLAEKLHQGN